MKRTDQDEKWVEVKQQVFERDGHRDRLLQVISAVQAQAFFNDTKGNPLAKTLDPAHVLAVSRHPKLCYEACNIITLNRVAHERLDSNHSPITGKLISTSEVNAWWKALLGKAQYEELISFDEAKIFFDL